MEFERESGGISGGFMAYISRLAVVPFGTHWQYLEMLLEDLQAGLESLQLS